MRATDKKWKNALEDIIGPHLNGFIVSSSKDRELLVRIFSKHNCNSPIVIIGNSPIDSSKGEPDARYLTALKALEVILLFYILQISNPLVRKTLIVLTGLERYILVHDRIKAQEEIKRHPPNVDAVYTYNGRFNVSNHSLTYCSLRQLGNGLSRLLDSTLCGLEGINELLDNSKQKQLNLTTKTSELEREHLMLSKAKSLKLVLCSFHIARINLLH